MNNLSVKLKLEFIDWTVLISQNPYG